MDLKLSNQLIAFRVNNPGMLEPQALEEIPDADWRVHCGTDKSAFQEDRHDVS
jgi:hypothetical protein